MVVSEAVSRGGWHAQHLRHGAPQPGKLASSNTRGDRTRLLKEAMRALDESDSSRQAARNGSIVAEDTHLNRAYANDGEGGFRELTPEDGVEPVLAYGDGRINSVRRKWHPKAFETTTIVSWVPKSLLVEIPDYYPVYDAKTKKEIGRRSRWVMPDDEAGKAEVQRWFEETNKHLTEDVLTGGHASIHGVVWNFDESVVHVHWMADTMAPIHKDMSVDEAGHMLDAAGKPITKYKKSLTIDKVVQSVTDLDGVARVAHADSIRLDAIGAIDGSGRLVDRDGELLTDAEGKPVMASHDLKVEAQQMWGQSDDVTETRMVDGVEREVKITGATKASRYQTIYREHLIEAGFAIEAEVNERGTSLAKMAYGASEAEKVAVANQALALDEREVRVDAAAAARTAALDQREAAIAAHEADVTARLDRRAATLATDRATVDARYAAVDDVMGEALAEREAVRSSIAAAC